MILDRDKGSSLRGVLLKKQFLKISQNIQENICAWDFFLKKVAGLKTI